MRDATGRTRRTSLSRLRVATVDRPTVQPSTDRPTDRDDGGHDTHDTKNNGIEYVSLDYVYTSHASYTYMSRGHDIPYIRTHTPISLAHIRTHASSVDARSVGRPRARARRHFRERIDRTHHVCLYHLLHRRSRRLQDRGREEVRLHQGGRVHGKRQEGARVGRPR